MIRSFQEIVDALKKEKAPKIAVAAAADDDVLASVLHAKREGIAEPILIGSKKDIEDLAKEHAFDISACEILDEEDPIAASALAVKLVREQKADTLMKGLVGTSVVLKAVLNRESGIRSGKLLSHLGMFYSEAQKRFLFISDAAINIAPDVDTKENIINNTVRAMHLLGYENPKVGCICALEKVNPAMPATLDAEELVKRNQNGQIKGCTVSGPFALDNALSTESAKLKGVSWANAGEIDFLLMPQIEAGNVLYKALTTIAKVEGAGVVLGAKVPVILSSRADSEETKFNSIALASYLAVKAKK